MFDLADPSNFGYYLSFSQDNQYKLEYSFNNITREGTPGVPTTSTAPFVKFTVLGDVTNISTTLTHQELELILLLVISRLLMSSRHLMMAHLQFLKLLQILSLDSHSLESLSKHLLRLALMSLTMHTHIIQRHLPKQLVLSTASNWYHLVDSIRDFLSSLILHLIVKLRRSTSQMVAQNMHLASTMM